MRKRLFLVIMIISIITSALTSILTTYVYYDFYVKNAKDQLKLIVNMSNEPDMWSDTAIDSSVNNILKSVDYSMRFTIVHKNGNVIYDSWAGVITESHKDRPEVAEAFEKGFGEDTRYSNTVSSNMFYYATKLNNDQVLRLSREINSINSVFAGLLPILFVLFIFVVIIVYTAAVIITRIIFKPINEMTNSLDEMLKEGSKDIKIYEELEPLSNKIKEQKNKINHYINELKYERDTISFITENMKEGFILLNHNKNVLSINKSGKTMIGNEKFDLTGNKNILELTRNSDIIENVDIAIKEKKHIFYDLKASGKYYRYYFSPVMDNTSVAGLLILIEDITIQKNSELMRREFSANVSHELKTPLTTMIGFAEMIKEGLITDKASIEKYSDMIYKEGLRLISLIEDILRLSKIEESIGVDGEVLINIKGISEEIVAMLKSKAENYDVMLCLNSQNIEMKANRNYISELLYNLIDNGIKYNIKGGKVDIYIYKEKNIINITVSDTGVGISQEHQNRIFERFYRVDKSRSKETGGTGLGLSIVKHIVELYKGTITMQSTENKGTQITIKLPNPAGTVLGGHLS